jgi:hypothetical protein
MTRILWAIEAFRHGVWTLLPNVIMVDRKNAEFELKCLRDEEKSNAKPERYRLVRYQRMEDAHVDEGST